MVSSSLLACTRRSSSFLQGLAGDYTADRVLQRCMLLFLIKARLSFPTFVCLRIQHLQSKKAGKDGSSVLQQDRLKQTGKAICLACRLPVAAWPCFLSLPHCSRTNLLQ